MSSGLEIHLGSSSVWRQIPAIMNKYVSQPRCRNQIENVALNKNHSQKDGPSAKLFSPQLNERWLCPTLPETIVKILNFARGRISTNTKYAITTYFREKI